MTSLSDRIREAVLARREIAEAATPGPWKAADGKWSGCHWIDAGEYDEVLSPADVECSGHCYGGSSRIEFEKADQAHVVDNGPDVVLRQCDADIELLDLLEEAITDMISEDAILTNLTTRYGVSVPIPWTPASELPDVEPQDWSDYDSEDVIQ